MPYFDCIEKENGEVVSVTIEGVKYTRRPECKPCPYCGSKRVNPYANGLYSAICLDCGAQGAAAFTDKLEKSGLSDHEIVRLKMLAWNNRDDRNSK